MANLVEKTDTNRISRYLPGARVRNSAHGKGHEEGGFSIRKGRIEPLETPLFLSIYPQNYSAYFTVLCSHLYLWLYGVLSPITSLREGVNLQLQSIKILGVTRVSQVRPLCWQTSFCDRIIHTPATTHMIVYYLSTINSTEFGVFWESWLAQGFSHCWVNDCHQTSISLSTWEYINQCIWNIEKEI